MASQLRVSAWAIRNPIPVTVLFIGLVIAFIGANLLAMFNASVFTVELVGIGMLREFGAVLTDEERSTDIDTVGGLVIAEFGRVPKRGDAVSFGGFHFQVLRADSRRIHSLLVERLPDTDTVGG